MCQGCVGLVRASRDLACTHGQPPPALPSSPKQPNVASTTKKFSYKLVKTGSVVLTASTDLRGYVAGQVLRLQADIENQSGKATGPVMASLLQVRDLTSWGGGGLPAQAHRLSLPQKVAYKAKRWIYDLRTIAEVEGAGVKAWRRSQWQEQILLPALPQSALPGCSLIHVDYYLQVLGAGREGRGGRGDTARPSLPIPFPHPTLPCRSP